MKPYHSRTGLNLSLFDVVGQRLKFYGLTGGIGSGKSTVAKVLEDLGATVLYADDMVKSFYHPNHPVCEMVLEVLGIDPSTAEGRRRLRNEVLTDPVKKSHLEAIVFLAAVDAAWQARNDLQRAGKKIVFYESALIADPDLFAGHLCLHSLKNLFDGLVLVDAPLQTRVRRVMKRDGVTKAEALTLIQAQKIQIDEIINGLILQAVIRSLIQVAVCMISKK